MVGYDIGYGNSESVGGSNMFLFSWINVPEIHVYMVCMVCPVLTFVRHFENSSLRRVESPRHYNVILIRD